MASLPTLCIALAERNHLEATQTRTQACTTLTGVAQAAAALENTTVTAFVLGSVTARAEQVVRRHRDPVLASGDFDRFIAEPGKPAAPVPELAALSERCQTA
jgi:uncharacterized protein (DUF1778 family)